MKSNMIQLYNLVKITFFPILKFCNEDSNCIISPSESSCGVPRYAVTALRSEPFNRCAPQTHPADGVYWCDFMKKRTPCCLVQPLQLRHALLVPSIDQQRPPVLGTRQGATCCPGRSQLGSSESLAGERELSVW